MKQGVGLVLSLGWASVASAQRAVEDFCWKRELQAAVEAGAALEYAAKAAAAEVLGPSSLFSGSPPFADAELWSAATRTFVTRLRPNQQRARWRGLRCLHGARSIAARQ